MCVSLRGEAKLLLTAIHCLLYFTVDRLISKEMGFQDSELILEHFCVRFSDSYCIAFFRYRVDKQTYKRH